ncbi:hypothetical protein [Paenibacillus thiaminolyticus]|uniref:hypothetical protein n=1 Tax=Paenibacillus thiaminolyticus TaxID=49283 RepID=UPI0011C470A7|nr:hypothetical protein [Paenibacillus thiaminolyticus]
MPAPFGSAGRYSVYQRCQRIRMHAGSPNMRPEGLSTFTFSLMTAGESNTPLGIFVTTGS